MHSTNSSKVCVLKSKVAEKIVKSSIKQLKLLENINFMKTISRKHLSNAIILKKFREINSLVTSLVLYTKEKALLSRNFC